MISGDSLTKSGLTRCDMIAEAIIGAAAEIGPLRVPLVVRLQGTNSEEGLKLVSWPITENWSVRTAELTLAL